MKKTRAEWLEEARLLEQMDGEWEVGHAAAFCTVSASFMYGSDCPRVEKEGRKGVKGRAMIRYIPWQVRQWNGERTRLEAALGRFDARRRRWK